VEQAHLPHLEGLLPVRWTNPSKAFKDEIKNNVKSLQVGEGLPPLGLRHSREI